ncbi:TRAP transporter large permease subunit [Aureimonas flava]|uniref:TRAP transporter large permease subunit n=1 Tax=Aureimonas flava TaxID=2320271 RepID=A0A3A1WIU0_9HYPH|nr:SLC13 family permease [Aureimonas flava]RIX99635.1 TRAP transporter large permease subunit [Aureimonas flava]
MTLDQALAFGLVGLTVAGFVWGRLPYDLIALLGLLAGVITGIVPVKAAFSGFSDDVVVIVVAALLVSAAIARSGVVEDIMRPLMPHMRTARRQVFVLVGAVTLLSMVTKNVGALAMFMPIASQVSRKNGTSISQLLMPMAFGSLIGGLVTLVGTSPNIIVSKIRQDMTGQPFAMFDYAPVGLGVVICGFLFLSLASGLIPKRKPAGGMGEAFALDAYTAEVEIPENSAIAGRTVAELESAADNDIAVRLVIRERFRRHEPTPGMVLKAGDLLLLGGEPEGIERAVARAGLRLSGDLPTRGDIETESVVEGVVTPQSPIIGSRLGSLALESAQGVAVLAVSRSGRPIEQRLASLRLREGDVLVLKGTSESVPAALAELRILPLAERSIVLGRSRRSFIPLGVLAAAMVLTATGYVPAVAAFFGAAVVLLLLRVMSMHEAYGTVEASVIVLLAALIPLSEAIQTTGGTDLIAGWLSVALHGLSPLASLFMVTLLAMAVTPFLNNAATVLMLGPIAGSLAMRLGLNPDPFLMAVALGAACDFLTPIGHQCNTIVMAPGGYRFGDYWRLGLPLSAIVLLVGVPLIALFWPVGG